MGSTGGTVLAGKEGKTSQQKWHLGAGAAPRGLPAQLVRRSMACWGWWGGTKQLHVTRRWGWGQRGHIRAGDEIYMGRWEAEPHSGKLLPAVGEDGAEQTGGGMLSQLVQEPPGSATGNKMEGEKGGRR